MYVRIYSYMYRHIHQYLHTDFYMFLYIYIYIYTHTHTHTHTHTITYICICMYMYICIYMYMYIYLYTKTTHIVYICSPSNNQEDRDSELVSPQRGGGGSPSKSHGQVCEYWMRVSSSLLTRCWSLLSESRSILTEFNVLQENVKRSDAYLHTG